MQALMAISSELVFDPDSAEFSTLSFSMNRTLGLLAGYRIALCICAPMGLDS